MGSVRVCRNSIAVFALPATPWICSPWSATVLAAAAPAAAARSAARSASASAVEMPLPWVGLPAPSKAARSLTVSESAATAPGAALPELCHLATGSSAPHCAIRSLSSSGWLLPAVPLVSMFRALALAFFALHVIHSLIACFGAQLAQNTPPQDRQ